MCHNDVETKIDYSSDRYQRKERKVFLVWVNNSTKLFSVDILIHLLNFYGIRIFQVPMMNCGVWYWNLKGNFEKEKTICLRWEQFQTFYEAACAFLAHLIRRMQMCYWCRKLEIWGSRSALCIQCFSLAQTDHMGADPLSGAEPSRERIPSRKRIPSLSQSEAQNREWIGSGSGGIHSREGICSHLSCDLYKPIRE